MMYPEYESDNTWRDQAYAAGVLDESSDTEYIPPGAGHRHGTHGLQVQPMGLDNCVSLSNVGFEVDLSLFDPDIQFSTVSHHRQSSANTSLPSSNTSRGMLYPSQYPRDAEILGHMASQSSSSYGLLVAQQPSISPAQSSAPAMLTANQQSLLGALSSHNHRKRTHSHVPLTSEQKRQRKKITNDARVQMSDFKNNTQFHKTLHVIRDKAICTIATRNPFPDEGKKQAIGKQEIIRHLYVTEASSLLSNPNKEELSTGLLSMVRLAFALDTKAKYIFPSLLQVQTPPPMDSCARPRF